MRPRLSNALHQEIKDWWKEDTQPRSAATRTGIGLGLERVSKKVVVLTADLAESTNVHGFKKKYPRRFVDVGVAEQALAGISAGLASEGFIPVMTSFAVFNPGRNWDFIRSQIAMTKAHVVIVGSHAGLATGPDGATHQALEDVALMRSLPNMRVISPVDANEAALAMKDSLSHQGPSYLRVVREKTPILFDDSKLDALKCRWLVHGKDAVIITTGSMAWQALQAAKLLWYHANIAISVLTVPIIKPLDAKMIQKTAGYKHIYVLEDHNEIGGLGTAVAEVLVDEKKHGDFKRFAVPDRFGGSGTVSELYKSFGLDELSLARRIIHDVHRLRLWTFNKSYQEKNIKREEPREEDKKVSIMVKKKTKKKVARKKTRKPAKKAAKKKVKKAKKKVKKPAKKAKKKATKKKAKKKVKKPAKKAKKKVIKKKPVKKKVAKKAKPTMSAFLNTWVKSHPHGWNHSDWMDLLSQLSKKGYKYAPDKVGNYIEKQRRKYFGW